MRATISVVSESSSFWLNFSVMLRTAFAERVNTGVVVKIFALRQMASAFWRVGRMSASSVSEADLQPGHHGRGLPDDLRATKLLLEKMASGTRSQYQAARTGSRCDNVPRAVRDHGHEMLSSRAGGTAIFELVVRKQAVSRPAAAPAADLALRSSRRCRSAVEIAAHRVGADPRCRSGADSSPAACRPARSRAPRRAAAPARLSTATSRNMLARPDRGSAPCWPRAGRSRRRGAGRLGADADRQQLALVADDPAEREADPAHRRRARRGRPRRAARSGRSRPAWPADGRDRSGSRPPRSSSCAAATGARGRTGRRCGC